jgi:hypothetical protein
MIATYGRENLCNHTDGGDGVSGYRHKDEHKKIMSEKRLGRRHSAETRKKMSDWHKANCKPPFKGKKLSSAHKKAVGDAVRGESNGRYDKTEYVFSHSVHGDFVGTQRNFIEKYGLHHGAVSGMLRGKVKSVKGWQFERRQD